MKTLISLFILTFSAISGFSQAKTDFLADYYGMKNALVEGDAATAAAKSAGFVKSLEAFEHPSLNDATRKTLVKEAQFIASSKDLKAQREHFAPFSDAMIASVKAAKLSAAPIYIQYCPMKKSSWLSADKGVKNPYYGSMMLTCGKVTETVE